MFEADPHSGGGGSNKASSLHPTLPKKTEKKQKTNNKIRLEKTTS